MAIEISVYVYEFSNIREHLVTIHTMSIYNGEIIFEAIIPIIYKCSSGSGVIPPIILGKVLSVTILIPDNRHIYMCIIYAYPSDNLRINFLEFCDRVLRVVIQILGNFDYFIIEIRTRRDFLSVDNSVDTDKRNKQKDGKRKQVD